jgi:hypothetical protein
MRYAVIVIMALVPNGCATVWHNRDYPVQSSPGKCPAPHWPYVVDGALVVAALTTATLFATKTLKPQDFGSNDTTPPAFYGPAFLLSGVGLVSMGNGLGAVMECNEINTGQ